MELVTAVYTQLTGREVKAAKQQTRNGDMAASCADPTIDTQTGPAFAKPTTTSLLAANIRDSELVTTLNDNKAAQARAKELVDEHGAHLRQVILSFA